MKISKKLSVLVLSLFLAGVVWTGCAKKNSDEIVVKIGITQDFHPQWDEVSKILKKEGIKLELVKFSDYSQPNLALASGEIDLNAFQHYAFLEGEIKAKGYKLTPIGDTIITPLGLYSQKIKSVSELKNGDSIAIPSDSVNGGRALLVLQTAGLIKVDTKGGYLPNVKDITSNPLHLKIIEVEAAQLPRLLPDVTAAFINGGHAVDAGLNPQKDSILLEKQEAGKQNPYINVIVARTADKDNPVYKKVVDAFHTDEVREVILKEFKGAYSPAW
ncbi:MAG: MetQ/NlpA family ABC transporter substrate-binding protein [Elusimicrobiota bacterium]|jgi:D-methionine transport system substrate-binding protein|nr:MetQ/NlpA family ABC transporter substrate-binding protein [Elusimicrobiota bacterium]